MCIIDVLHNLLRSRLCLLGVTLDPYTPNRFPGRLLNEILPGLWEDERSSAHPYGSVVGVNVSTVDKGNFIHERVRLGVLVPFVQESLWGVPSTGKP